MPREHWGQSLLISGPQIPIGCLRKVVARVGVGYPSLKVSQVATQTPVGYLQCVGQNWLPKTESTPDNVKEAGHSGVPGNPLNIW